MRLRGLLRGPLGLVIGAWAVLTAAGLLLFGLSGGFGDWFGGGPAAHEASPAPASPAAAGPTASPAVPRVPPVTTVATVLRATERYASPGHPGHGTVPLTWWTRPSVLPVIATRPGWVRVRTAQRPNGSTAWLPSRDVRLGTTPYRIVINLAATRLNLYKGGRLVMSAPAGVGAAGDSTPVGEYFAAFKEPPPGPGYGEFVMVTSAHSPDIADWNGSGDAIIGIHGPLGDDAAIGTTGARISHGCVRLHEAALERLAAVPPGTPIDVAE